MITFYSFRRDADAVVRHGFWEEAGQVGELPPVWEEPDRFANYTAATWNSREKADLAPVVWWVVNPVAWSLGDCCRFVSHCKSESGRDRYVRQLAQHIGVHVYGKCGDRQCGQDRRLRNPYQVGVG